MKKIDYFVISHFHADHVGGLPVLSKMIPIRRFFDRGEAIERKNQQWLGGYLDVLTGNRTIVKAGDTVPIKGFHALVVSSSGALIPKPVNGGGPNPLCADAE